MGPRADQGHLLRRPAGTDYPGQGICFGPLVLRPRHSRPLPARLPRVLLPSLRRHPVHISRQGSRPRSATPPRGPGCLRPAANASRSTTAGLAPQPPVMAAAQGQRRHARQAGRGSRSGGPGCRCPRPAAIGGYLALRRLKAGWWSGMPMSANEVRHALRELEALRRIVDATHQLFAVDGAGLMLIDPDQLLRNVAVSDRRVHDLEELQIEHGEGPCVDAFEDKTLVDTEDLAAEARWPNFSPAAVDRGLRAVLASPIPYNQQAIGVVVVFSAKAQPWSPEGELALVAFTDLAALTIANTLQSEERGELAAQLQRALEARVVIEQAKGALVAQEGVSEREAFERLRRQARAERRRVVEVANEIMADIRHP